MKYTCAGHDTKAVFCKRINDTKYNIIEMSEVTLEDLSDLSCKKYLKDAHFFLNVISLY